MSALAPAVTDPARGRKLALGLLLLAILAAVAVSALIAWLPYNRYERELADRRDKLERFSRIAATRSWWYGLARLSACPMTSRLRMPKRSWR